ncbi:DNA primase, partial [Streptococcus pyogenes]
LPDCYASADDYSQKPRYTYLKGTSTSGAVVEDDGLFLYSHHGSDPCADMLVNAFDLVRIHLFGELDEDSPKETPPTKWPSYKRMI